MITLANEKKELSIPTRMECAKRFAIINELDLVMFVYTELGETYLNIGYFEDLASAELFYREMGAKIKSENWSCAAYINGVWDDPHGYINGLDEK